MAPAEEARPPHQGNGDEPSSANGTSASPSSSTRVSANWVGNNMAQALRDLARGEQTAAALEANLTSLENKLDELLASFSAPLEEEETTDKAASPDTKLPPKDSDKKGDEGQKTNSETK